MAYASGYVFAFWHLIKDDRDLTFRVRRCTQLDFGDYGPRGGGTTIAHLRWVPDDDLKTTVIACKFEGLTGEHTLTLEKPLGEDDFVSPADVERIVAHWKGFTEANQKHHEVERFEQRCEQLRREA